jgi:outer membrane protein OmpA-like peptidoglycan-associated protein
MKKMSFDGSTKIALASLAACLFSANASALGVNAENYAPAAGNSSALLHETSQTLSHKSWMFGVTADYALRPIELGDGKSTRVGVVDHLLMSHFSAGYGLLRNLELSGVLPLALWNSYDNPENYLLGVGGTRKFVLFSDPRIGLKLNALDWGSSIAGSHSVAVEMRVPLGESAALLSDGTMRTKFSLPSSIFSTSGDWEFNLTPGVILWSDRDRVVADNGLPDGRRTFLSRSWAASWETGLQWTASGTPRNREHLSLEAGLRAEFSQGYLSVSSAGNPWEWGFGAKYVADENMTFHGSVGSSIGRGVASPMMRLMAGVRYSTGGSKDNVVSDDVGDSRYALPAYSDVELDRILADSRGEDSPRQLASDESLLRLMVGDEIIDIGYVRFKFASAELTPEARRTIDALRDRLKIEQPRTVTIEGHTDSVGSLEVNMALSKRRADAVKKALAEGGIDSSIIRTSGVAFRYPVASNATKQGRAANRRIEVSLNGKYFRKVNPSPQEMIKYKEWIAPGGRRPARD